MHEQYALTDTRFEGQSPDLANALLLLPTSNVGDLIWVCNIATINRHGARKNADGKALNVKLAFNGPGCQGFGRRSELRCRVAGQAPHWG